MDILQGLKRLFIWTLIANVIMLIIIIRSYAGSFSLLMDPLSWLGKVNTDGGQTNTIALVLFNSGLLLNAYRWKKALNLTVHNSTGRHPLARFLGHVVLVGFILMAFPCDIFVTLHSIGGGMVVGGLWAFTTALIYHVREELGAGTHTFLQLTLHTVALFCGTNFVLDTALKGFSQRPLLIAIIIGTGISLNALTKNWQGKVQQSRIRVV